MIRNVCLIIFLLATAFELKAQTDSIIHRVWLVGDAGKLKNGMNPQLEFLKKLNLLDKKSTVLFLGDNIYPVGLPDSQSRQFPEKKRILDQQVSLVKNTDAQAFFIPGNHDWLEGRSKGWQQIIHQYGYIKSLELSNVQFLPANGCPGPVEVPLNDKSVLVIMDTQWWLQQNDRPGENDDCDCKNEDEVVSRLNEIVFRNKGKLLFFASHHPFKTNGPHGGYFTAKQHLFPLTDFNPKLYIPLPVLGSLYPLLRGTFGNIQDVKHPLYKSMIQKLDEVLSQHPYCIRVSGHEHSLQYIQQNNQYYIVSGAASKSSPVRAGKGTIYAQKWEGFGLIELFTDGRIKLKFYSLKNKQEPIYEVALRTFQEKPVSGDLDIISTFPDSVTATAAPGFKAGKLKRFLWGDNYRNEWSNPIQVPVFNIAKEKGGLKALLQGGRLQSKSLRLEDSAGHQYVLRSIEKYPERILPEEFRQTFIKNALVDAISASYPYAAVSVPILATAAGIPHANPKIVFMPDDPRLGIYRTDFANKLFIFEEREPGGLKKTYSTPKVLEELQKDNDNTIDEHATLLARLLDMFMMDFDRHEDQWRWGKNEKKKGDSYFPIPRDRDQPFFINQGIIPRIISKPWLQPRFQGFRKKAKNINTYNFNGRFFDRLFLTGLSKQDWEKATDAFIPLMTDSIIESALKKQPIAIQSYSLPFIIKTLKERRNYLKGDVMKYYKFLAKEVDIYGTDKKEWFAIERLMDGGVHIQLYKLDKEGRKTTKTFDRIFYSSETKEIRLWGKGGDDYFDMQGNGFHTIRVRIVGGPGNDIMNIASQHTKKGKTILYDLTTEQNTITGNGKWKNKFADDPIVNETSLRAYKYDILMPQLAATFNPDDGLFLGLTIKNTSHGFRKQPYKAIHQWKATYAVATAAYNFSYHFDAVDIIGKTDLLIQAELKAPNNTTNFFGIGNETIFDRSAGKKINFYRTRYNTINGAALFKINPAAGISLLAGPVFSYFNIDSADNENRIIIAANVPGIDPLSLFKSKSFAGARVQMNIDLRNNKTITTRGMFWQSYFQALKGLSGSSTNLTQLSTDLSFYTSFSKAAKLVLAGRIGGGINFGKYQFFQAQYLGGNDNLRGFRKYRFAGDKTLYTNIDIRLHLFDFKGYIIPGSIGLVGFNDIGRVWIKGENSSAWHHGYGGGIWIAPAKRYVITACYAYSKDGGLPFVSLGFQF